MLKRFILEESGQGMVEYGLILVLVSIAAMAALGNLGQNTIRPMYNKLNQAFPKKVN